MRVVANRTMFSATEVKDEKRFSRSSLYVVLFAVTLLFFGIGFKVYRFTLPSEGWSLGVDFSQGLIFDQNLLGSPSPFQKGDILLDVAGENIPIEVYDPFRPPDAAAHEMYRVGNIVPYTVLRGGQEVTFSVPLYHWTTSGITNALWQVILGQVFQFNIFVVVGLAIASFVFSKRPNNRAAQLLLLIFVAMFTSGLSNVVSLFTPADVLDPIARVTSALFGADIHPLLLIPLFLHLALVFPKPKWRVDTFAVLLVIYGLPLLMHAIRDFHIIPNFSADVFVPFYFLLVAISFIHSLVTTKEKETRAQTKWVAYGFSLVALGSIFWVLSAILGWLPPSVTTIINWFPSELVLCLCLSIAILRYRLFDIDVIMNRTLVYGTLSLGVVAVYSGLVTGSSYLLQTQSNTALSLIAVAIILFLLKPSYQLLQRSANRFVPVTSVNHNTVTVSSNFTSSRDAENVSTRTEARAKNSRHSARLVIIFAVALLLLAVAQKAYRFTLPFEGWSTTTDFESDEPILDKKLLDVPSDLQTGDRVIAVNGVPYLEIQERAIRGETSLLESYRFGETVRYTVLREGQELEVDVPLYAGTSLGLGNILWQFFTSNGLGDFMYVLGVAVAVFIFWKRPHNLTAQLLFLQGMATVASGISWTVTPLGVADSLHPFTFYVAGFFTHWIHLLLEQPLGLHIILSFPRPSAILQKRWSLPLLYGLPLLVLAVSLLGIAPFFSPFIIVALYNLLGIIAAVRLFFSRRDPVETAQVRWFVFGFAVTNLGLVSFGLMVAGLIPEGFGGVLEAIPSQLIFLICMAIAILRYRLFDINIILNRTLVYGGLTAGIVGLYALVVGGVGRLIHVENNVVLSLLATGLVAVAFNPLRVRLQRSVNRLLYGDRDDPYQVLSKLSGQMEGTVEPSKLLPTMTETIATTLKLPYTAIALGQNGNMQIVAAHGISKSESVKLPLAYQGETVGELRLEPRAGETFKTPELNLLKTIAQQASVAAHTVKQNLDLQHSREALVTAREEERLRIRRDLHDGLGPELASLTLKLDATRNILKNDTDKAEKLLVELKHQTQDAVASIRRLVYALRPPALDELGLEGALREQARSYDHVLNVQLDTVGDLPSLPAAVEVACYRIAQEALTNVVRHSRAKHCTIILCATHKLFIDVQDDGVGVPKQHRSGVGLRSMRERAEELGGTFTLTSSEKGTRLLATLPLTTETRERKEERE
jgi:signal transduction histidine kinase